MSRTFSLLLCLLATGCAQSGGPYPSLQPRAAEAVDPRVPVERPVNDRPVTAALAARLFALVAEARGGDGAFASLIDQADRLAAASGPMQSEGWIAAQEALSAAVAARGPTVRALGDIDGLGAERLAQQGGLSPSDLAAIRAAAAEVSATERRQAARIAAVQRRLGR
ncbi:MAG: hypothetical protein ABIS38_04920 [Sphingomicrobium sp.]